MADRGRPALDALVIEGLERIARTRRPADRVSKALLRAHPELDGPGRARVSRGLFGVRCHARRLEHQLTQVGLPLTATFAWAAYRVTVLHEPPAEVAADLEQPGIVGPLARLDAAPWPEDPVARLAVQRSLPTWIARRWASRYGLEAADALAVALSEPGPITLRAARRRGGRGALARALAADGVKTRPGRLAEEALSAERFDIRGHPAFVAGDFEVQDEGSQLVAAAVEARPGERVLDLCAGAGGKTLALADHMDDRGELFAADVDPARLADLKGRIRQRGLRSVEILDARRRPPPKGMDLALVDAPCSALGTWRRGPDRRWHVLEAQIPAFAELQLRLLRDAAACLRPGGRLVYATCTLLEAENEAVARAFGAAEPRFEPAPVLPATFGGATEIELRPDRHGTDGFFIAAWRARASAGPGGP